MEITIERADRKPVYLQIRDSIISQIEKGLLNEGVRLPSTRDLADDLKINRSTACKAYRDLWSLGYIESRPGSYTVVRDRRIPASPEITDERGFPPWTGRLEIPDDLHSEKFSSPGQPYDFRPLFPDPSIIPVGDFRKTFNDVMKEKGPELMSYGNPAGYRPLRETICRMMSHHRIEAGLDQLMITEGAQRSLELLCCLFRKETWSVVMENPGYSEAAALFRYHGAEILPCAMGENGPDTEQLARYLETDSPSFVYTVSNYQNPTGYSSDQSTREIMLRLCEKYNVPIVEDGFSEDMRGTIYPIKSMDTNQIVIYVGTFSKILFPGIRTGWIYGNRKCVEALTNLQYMSGLSGNFPIQAAIDRFCRLGYYEQHLKRVYGLYRKRMITALNCLEEHMSPDLGTYTKPKGGYSLWITLSDRFSDERTVLRKLERNGVSLSPGSRNCLTDDGLVHLRISIAHSDEKEIREGIGIICSTLRSVTEDRDIG